MTLAFLSYFQDIQIEDPILNQSDGKKTIWKAHSMTKMFDIVFEGTKVKPFTLKKLKKKIEYENMSSDTDMNPEKEEEENLDLQSVQHFGPKYFNHF